MTDHKRRVEYWKYYHESHSRELGFLLSHLVSLIEEKPYPVSPNRGPGRPPVHDRNKMACLCI